MRPSLLVLFFLFSILISHVQGIRLNKEFLSIGHDKVHKRIMNKASNTGEDVHCKDGHCSGNIRKLMTKATSNPSTTTTIVKNDENKSNASPKSVGLHGKDESLSVMSSTDSEHRQGIPEQYPDVIDLAGMDYSPAKRKPPIHN